MNQTDIALSRLQSQRIAASQFQTPKEVVEWMGAMQAQDYAMAKWGVGLRLPNATHALIEKAVSQGDIVRTHVLRPTWHFVSPNDIGWMLQLTAPHIKPASNARNKELGLTSEVFAKSNSLIEQILDNGNHLTREELMIEMGNRQFLANVAQMYHLMMEAELDGIVCSGIPKGKEQTYALLAERAPHPKALTRDEAATKLAKTYFSSHAPATLYDFVWWSGLSITTARQALESLKGEFLSEKVEGQTYWFPNDFAFVSPTSHSVYMLPAFDEYMVSYKDRTASIAHEHRGHAMTSNGIFKPIIVINGRVTGLWKRSVKKGKVLVETSFFSPHDPAHQPLINKAAEGFGSFLELQTETLY